MIGAGNIVEACLDAISQIDGMVCNAIFVRETSYARAQQLGEKYAISKIYRDYQAMLDDPEIDFVYVGIPNNMHYDYSLAALNAGKHVICEKPFTKLASELIELAETARRKGLFLFEAVTNIHAPNVVLAKQLLPRIGAVKLVQGNYSQLSSRYARYLNGEVHAAFDPQFAGGALYDINVYNLHLACFLLGVPDEVRYTCNQGFNGIDTSGVMVMNYPEFVAVCCGAKDSQSPGHFTIQGELGYLTILGTPNIAAGVELVVGGERERFNQHDVENHMVFELRNFQTMYQHTQHDACYRYLDHSINVMKILEQGRAQAGDFAPHIAKI